LSSVPPLKSVPVPNLSHHNWGATEIDVIDEVFFDGLLKESINKEMGLAQIEIYQLLLDEMVERVPYDTNPNRATGKPHLRDVIEDRSRIEGDNVIIGSGDFKDPYTGRDYAKWLNHGFMERLGASRNDPATTWTAKDIRKKFGKLEDPLSVTPYLYATAYGNLHNIGRIILKHLFNAFDGFDYIEGYDITGSIRDIIGKGATWEGQNK